MGAPGAPAEIVGLQETVDVAGVDGFVGGEHPGEFVEERLGFNGWVDGLLDGGEDGLFAFAIEQEFGLVAVPALGGAKLLDQLGQAHGFQLGALEEFAVVGGHAPDAAVGAIAAGIAVAGLVMADDRVEPITDIDGTVGADTGFERSELGAGA